MTPTSHRPHDGDPNPQGSVHGYPHAAGHLETVTLHFTAYLGTFRSLPQSVGCHSPMASQTRSKRPFRRHVSDAENKICCCLNDVCILVTDSEPSDSLWISDFRLAAFVPLPGRVHSSSLSASHPTLRYQRLFSPTVLGSSARPDGSRSVGVKMTAGCTLKAEDQRY